MTLRPGTGRAPDCASPRGEHLTADRSHAHPEDPIDDLEDHTLLGVYPDVRPAVTQSNGAFAK